MEPTAGGQDAKMRQKITATDIARQKVLAAYNSDGKAKPYRDMGRTAGKMSARINRSFGKTALSTHDLSRPANYKEIPIQTNVVAEAAKAAKDAPDTATTDWQKYHSAWQWYYQRYYSEYYAKAANQYIEGERLKDARKKRDEEIVNPDMPVDPTDAEEEDIISTLKRNIKTRAKKDAKKSRRHKKFIPIVAGLVATLLVLFLQYNRMIFAPIMAYVSPGNTSDNGITEIDPTITKAVGPDNRLMIPKLNVDVPVHFGISNDTATINNAMENGVAQFAIPGASAMPGEIGNLVITGHSAGDIYSNNQYKFIFSGLERLNASDLIYIDYGGTRYTYSVTKMETVEPDNVGALVYETSQPVLTLITCTPLGTSRYRLLVTAEQISPKPSGATQSEPHVDDNSNSDSTESMPQNEPTFFECIWNWLTGNN